MKATLILVILAGVAVILGVLIGELVLTPAQVLMALIGQGTESHQIIVRDIRLPRVLCAGIVGFALGMSGAALQGLFRNPLAEPGVLGVSATAALFASSAIFFGMVEFGTWVIPAASGVGAILAVGILLLAILLDVSRVGLILLGVGLSSFSGALMLLLLNLAPHPFALSELINWTLGSVAYRSFVDIGLVLPFFLVGSAMVLAARRSLVLMILGEEVAQSEGVAMWRLRLFMVTGTGLLTGAAVALAGIVGFVGIAAPHIVRPNVGYDLSKSLLPSGILGAVLVMLADILVKLIHSTHELKLGVLMALIGAPLFVWIAIRKAPMP